MSKKKHPEHVNHERWLVSYADFITLLFAFFVVLFASGQSDKKKQKQVAQAMQVAFSQMGMFDSHAKTPPLADGGNAGPATLPSVSVLPPSPTPQSTAVQAVVERIVRENTQQAQAIEAAIHSAQQKQGVYGGKAEKDAAGKLNLTPLPADSVSLRQSREGLVISLREAGFFASGSADVNTRATPLLTQIAAALPTQPLRIEGHTDDRPMHNARFASNWELSSARASAIARIMLERSTVPPSQIAVAGYAEFHPMASNTTDEGRAQNRRVDIIVLNAATPSSRPAPSR